MLKSLFSLFKRAASKPRLVVRDIQLLREPKVTPTMIGELGEHEINNQLDQVVIFPYCLFVIETKNYNGEINGGRNGQ